MKQKKNDMVNLSSLFNFRALKLYIKTTKTTTIYKIASYKSNYYSSIKSPNKK